MDFRFIQSNLNKGSANTSSTVVTEDIYVVSTFKESRTSEVIVGHKESIISNGVDSVEEMYPQYRPMSMPIETKIVMRCENTCKPKPSMKKIQKPSSPIPQKDTAEVSLSLYYVYLIFQQQVQQSSEISIVYTDHRSDKK